MDMDKETMALQASIAIKEKEIVKLRATLADMEFWLGSLERDMASIRHWRETLQELLSKSASNQPSSPDSTKQEAE